MNRHLHTKTAEYVQNGHEHRQQFLDGGNWNKKAPFYAVFLMERSLGFCASKKKKLHFQSTAAVFEAGKHVCGSYKAHGHTLVFPAVIHDGSRAAECAKRKARAISFLHQFFFRFLAAGGGLKMFSSYVWHSLFH